MHGVATLCKVSLQSILYLDPWQRDASMANVSNLGPPNCLQGAESSHSAGHLGELTGDPVMHEDMQGSSFSCFFDDEGVREDMRGVCAGFDSFDSGVANFFIS
jgi:hypothetical protein